MEAPVVWKFEVAELICVLIPFLGKTRGEGQASGTVNRLQAQRFMDEHWDHVLHDWDRIKSNHAS